jgi:formamidopyrimidine-DNA glycosylase
LTYTNRFLPTDTPRANEMPELPEVEITRQGIAPCVIDHTIKDIIVRNPGLRWPVSSRLASSARGLRIERVARRAKYLVLYTRSGGIIIHLGMSGSLRILNQEEPPHQHDHVDIVLDDGNCLRYRDPRRFGCILWSRHPLRHRLLRDLGPEPLGEEFNGDYLFRAARGRKLAVKQFLMDARVVSGIGNIYANEALYCAGIHPLRAAGRIGRQRCRRLSDELKHILERAIDAGGTTLRDFRRADGNPGYFGLSLRIYGREGEPCPSCARPIRRRTTGQRSTYYCTHCQR